MSFEIDDLIDLCSYTTIVPYLVFVIYSTKNKIWAHKSCFVNSTTIYWNACTKPLQCAVMSMCVRGIHFTSVLRFFCHILEPFWRGGIFCINTLRLQLVSTYFSCHAVTEGVYVWILMLSDNTRLFIQVLIPKRLCGRHHSFSNGNSFDCFVLQQYDLYRTWLMVALLVSYKDKGNNKITKLRTILQRESQNSQVYKQTKSVNNRTTVKTVMTLTCTGISKEMVGWIRF